MADLRWCVVLAVTPVSVTTPPLVGICAGKHALPGSCRAPWVGTGGRWPAPLGQRHHRCQPAGRYEVRVVEHRVAACRVVRSSQLAGALLLRRL